MCWGNIKMSKLPSRKPNRYKYHCYSKSGTYFVTICTEGRKTILWQSANSAVGANSVRPLTKIGNITKKSVENISEYYANVFVDSYVIMPNHVHMILCIYNDGRTLFAPTVSRAIKHFKEYITKQTGCSIWQKSFHDHVIRNKHSYTNIKNYIQNNPQLWEYDCYNPERNTP